MWTFITVMFDVIFPRSRSPPFVGPGPLWYRLRSRTRPQASETDDRHTCTGFRTLVIHPGNRSIMEPWTIRDLAAEALRLIHDAEEQSFLNELLLHAAVITTPDELPDRDFYVFSLANLRTIRGPAATVVTPISHLHDLSRSNPFVKLLFVAGPRVFLQRSVPMDPMSSEERQETLSWYHRNILPQLPQEIHASEYMFQINFVAPNITNVNQSISFLATLPHTQPVHMAFVTAINQQNYMDPDQRELLIYLIQFARGYYQSPMQDRNLQRDGTPQPISWLMQTDQLPAFSVAFTTNMYIWNSS